MCMRNAEGLSPIKWSILIVLSKKKLIKQKYKQKLLCLFNHTTYICKDKKNTCVWKNLML